jgi:energy-coupling factor transporter ATP-binding protein EcfA2
MAKEALDLGFAALALGQDPPAYDARNPFRGLNPFRAEDRAFFFGREKLIEELQQRLAANPFLPVLGPSGSGKSSVVLAGLVPALTAASGSAGAEGLTLERDMRPGADPLARLDELLARLANSPGVVVIDQFEEVFTLCRDENTRVAFFDRMLALTEERPVVLTMRADFWGECAPYPELRTAMEAHQRLIAPLDAAELRAAIERQAGAVGLRFEADLAATILDQVQGEPGAMPLLQHALLELWQRRHGRWLLATEYRTIGGVQGAIAKTAETVYAGLTEPEQEQVLDIFVRLTRLDEEPASGVERRDTRRRVALEELVPVGGDVAATKALVARLASAGLVVTSRSAPVVAPPETVPTAEVAASPPPAAPTAPVTDLG